MSLHRTLSIFALLSFLSLAGCGGNPHDLPPNTVSGTVMLDGTPIKQGTIVFESPQDIAEGISGSAEIVDGKYHTTTTTGKKTVRISASVPEGSPDATGVQPMRETVPAKFNTNSKLSEEVKAGENTIDFDLKS